MESNLSISVRNTNVLPFDLVIAFLGNMPHIHPLRQKKKKMYKVIDSSIFL